MIRSVLKAAIWVACRKQTRREAKVGAGGTGRRLKEVPMGLDWLPRQIVWVRLGHWKAALVRRQT